ncbi:ribbon-helix-helix domain-containing protein [Brevundimonas sp. TWP2-3-4b1]|uniref:ribbon-helix-helix domain-containing protein n=1 Tax=Brevundimonas sp. TWP2-3-4b1 TaxID=2804580 RepID=UPI003CEE55FA
MANPALTLPPVLDAFIEEQVASGAYRDRDAVIADAVDLLRERATDHMDDETRLARLNAKLKKAIDGLDRGEGIEITDLDAYFDGVMKRVRVG